MPQLPTPCRRCSEPHPLLLAGGFVLCYVVLWARQVCGGMECSFNVVLI